MSAHRASLLNALILIGCSLWAYLSAAAPSLTALIPAGFGVLLLACYQGIKVDNKLVAHIAVVLTLLVLIALLVPLRGAIARGDALAVFRLAAMILSSGFAMVFFVKSFIDARKAREQSTEQG